VLSLSIPESWISAEASRIAVFPFSREVAESNELPNSRIERREEWESSLCEAALAAVSKDIVELVLKTGGDRILVEVEKMAERRSEADIAALRGNDPSFEQDLALHKQLHGEQKALAELFHLFSSKLLLREPTSELILKDLARGLQDNSLTPVEKLKTFRKALHSLARSDELTLQLLASTERVITLAVELSAPVTGQRGGMEVTVFKNDVPQEVLEQCAAIADSFTKNPDGIHSSDPKTHLNKGGGLITNEYTVEYFRSKLEEGARLVVTSNAEPAVRAYALYYPPEAVPQEIYDLHPAPARSEYGYYDILCAAPFATPTATLAANRRLLLDLQYSETRYLRAIIHESNHPGLKTTFGLGNQISAQRRIVRTLPELGDTVYYEVDFPISPESRSTYLKSANFDRRIQTSAITSLSSRSPSDVEHALLHPSPQERQQMSALVREHGDKPFRRLSWGVESMNSEGTTLLRNLVAQGYLNWIDGVVVTGAGRLAEKRSGTWVLKDSGTLSVIRPLLIKDPEVTVPVGLAPVNRMAPWSSRTEKVLLHGGQEKPSLKTRSAYRRTMKGTSTSGMWRRYGRSH
jgi:hypothetical protein